MKKNLSRLFRTLFVTICMISMFVTSEPVYAATVHYGDYGITGGIMCYSTRVKYTQTSCTSTTTKGSKTKVATIENTGSTKATKSITLSETTSRSYSVSANIPLDIIKADVKATIGGSVSYSKTISVSASAEVPKKSSSSVYLRYDTTTTTYTYTCQKQQQNIYGEWINVGKTYTKTLKVVTKVPVLTV